MSYIVRAEDGEHFVVPAYRDVLTVRHKNQLKNDIVLLSQSYGEYIALRKKNPTDYEVAFSPDAGYLLGESIWHHFKHPANMIYCEALPATNEAILVIVKAGSVYLDGSFPLESIPEELVIFLTQQNNFEIYTYGDVPISAEPVEGKFAFDPTSIKSFTILDAAVFPTLPLFKIYQLHLVEQVLRSQGIGVFPLRKAVVFVVIAGLVWMLWSYITAPKEEEMAPAAPAANPYQQYNVMLNSPAPDEIMTQFLNNIRIFYTAPGWTLSNIQYANNAITASAKSAGGKIQTLLNWGQINHVKVTLNPNSVILELPINLPKRPIPTKIYPIKEIMTHFIDKLTNMNHNTHLQMSNFVNKGAYTEMTFTINFTEMSPAILGLIGEQFKDLPFALQTITVNVNNSALSGSIVANALGSQ